MKAFKHATLMTAAVACTACNVSFKNSLITSHSDEVEAFADQAVSQFYANENAEIVKLARGENGFNIRLIEQMDEFRSESAKPMARRVLSRVTETKNGTKYFVSQYGIPREGGRETITITMTQPGGECCQLVGFNFNVNLGDAYMMNDDGEAGEG